MITKTGSCLAQYGLNKAAADGNVSGPVAKALGGAGRVLNGALWVGFPAASIASGESSVGEAIGETAGGFGGFELANKAMQKVLPSNVNTHGFSMFKPSTWSAKGLGGAMKGTGLGALRFGAGMVAGAVGSTIGSSVLGKLMPWKRPTPDANSYFGDNYTNNS